MQCPCCSAKSFETCCGPLLAGDEAAASAEALMRSRYTAYAQRDFEYILNTTDPQRRLDFDHAASREWMDGSTFTGLEILKSSEEGNKGVVEFKARFRTGDKAEETHHELSRFRKQGGVWYFREGKVIPPPPA
ncbi:MAG: hypothetical protein KF799_00800 [Bdellovibrionales bacterium]|nr:hypothetical protein [Bdellovibrionales bacterium]